MESRRECTDYSMSMVRVAFAERVVNCSKRWAIVVVMEKYLGRVGVVFVVVGW